MTWTKHHDTQGVVNYIKNFGQAAPPKEIIVNDYWTNEENVRIGLSGYGKNLTIFSYKSDKINFEFIIHRSYGEDSEIEIERLPWAPYSSGKYASVAIEPKIYGEATDEEIPGIIKNIDSFLRIYRFPRESGELIEHIDQKFSEKTLKRFGGQSNG